MNLVSELLQQSSRGPKDVAISFGGKLWQSEPLFEEVLRVASGLSERGVEPGEAVGVCFPNGPGFAVAYLAVLACGGVVVPQNVLLRPREWTEQSSDAQIRVQLCDDRFARLIAESAETRGVKVLAVNLAEPEPFRQLRGRALRPPLGRLPSDPAAMPYTAAYDGYYHGAILTHGSLLANARATAAVLGLTPEERVATFLPLFHGFGLTTTLLAPLLAGSEAVIIERFTPAEAVAALRARRPTSFPAVPTMIAQMFAEGLLSPEVVGTVQKFIVGGAALKNELYEKVLAGTGITLLQGYGLTENSPVVSTNRTPETQKVGSVGPPLPSVEVAVEKDGALVAPGVVGEVLVRGPSLMTGYHRAPEATAATLRDGWLHTRDLGYVDEDGFIFLTGRLLPMAIIGGFNVYPAELERVLRTHPSVESIEFQVLPDEIYGEMLTAAVQLRSGAETGVDDLQSWCRRQFSAYKIPRRFDAKSPEAA